MQFPTYDYMKRIAPWQNDLISSHTAQNVNKLLDKFCTLLYWTTCKVIKIVGQLRQKKKKLIYSAYFRASNVK